MKIEFELSLRKLFAECQHQSLIDAQMNRTETGQSLADDIALSDKNYDIFSTELVSVVSRLYSTFANLIQFTIGTSAIKIEISSPDVPEPSFSQSVVIGIKDYLKCAMLAWWNTSRGNSALMAVYTAKQGETRSYITNLITPKAERPYRYW